MKFDDAGGMNMYESSITADEPHIIPSILDIIILFPAQKKTGWPMWRLRLDISPFCDDQLHGGPALPPLPGDALHPPGPAHPISRCDLQESCNGEGRGGGTGRWELRVQNIKIRTVAFLL